MPRSYGIRAVAWMRLRDSRVIKCLARFAPRPLKHVVLQLMLPPLESLPDSPDLFRVYRVLYQHPDLERRPGGWIYKEKFYPDYLTVGGASHAIFQVAFKYCQGIGVDVGAGLWPLPRAIPVDIERGRGVDKAVSDFADNALDYVFSSHCLEHIGNWREVLTEWVKKIRPGGILFLYLPHPECAIWHPCSPFVGDGHKWVPTPGIIREAVLQLGCEVVGTDDGPDVMQSFYVCARKGAG